MRVVDRSAGSGGVKGQGEAARLGWESGILLFSRPGPEKSGERPSQRPWELQEGPSG